MKTKNRSAVAQSKTIATIRRITMSFTIMAMTIALVILTGAQSGVKANGTNSQPTGSSAGNVCNDRIDVTYSSGLQPTAVQPWFISSLRTDGVIKLKGYLYLPGGKSISDSLDELPAIIYNHGSGSTNHGQIVNHACEMAEYFTSRGFAFFIPHRRGHGDSTGMYVGDFVDIMAANQSSAAKHAWTLLYLQDQTYEVSRAIDFLSTLKNSAKKPVIDMNKVAIMGHSYGGMVTLFNNNLLTTHKAAVDIAGASESWDAYDNEDGSLDNSSASIDVLKAAVRGANKPIFFFEPKNDVSTRPTIVLSKVAGDADERYQAAIYGPVPLDPGETTTDAHSKFVTEQDQVEKWGPAVIEFLARHGVK